MQIPLRSHPKPTIPKAQTTQAKPATTKEAKTDRMMRLALDGAISLVGTHITSPDSLSTRSLTNTRWQDRANGEDHVSAHAKVISGENDVKITIAIRSVVHAVV